MKKFKKYLICWLAVVLGAINSRSQLPFSIDIFANELQDVTVFHNEALLLTLNLSNKDAQEKHRWNKAADRRLTELDELLATKKITQEYFNQEVMRLAAAKKLFRPVTIGSMTKSWPLMVHWKIYEIKTGALSEAEIRYMPNPGNENVAVLNERAFYQANYGIDPNVLKALHPGNYRLVAYLMEDSSQLTIRINSSDMPEMMAGSEEILLRTARYYWHAGEVAEGLTFADRLLKKNPTSVDGLSIRGDLLVQEFKYKEALADYKAAVGLYFKQYPAYIEPPQYLLEMIEWVKKQI